MFNEWFSGEQCSWYLLSAHKQRIDRAGTALLRLKYRSVVVRQHLHEWVRFDRYLAERALPLPSSFHGKEVQHYFAVRFPTGSPSRRRGIRAAIRIFLDLDDDGRFSRRVLAPQRATNPLFQEAVPTYLDFLRKHRGLSARTISKRAFQLTLFTAYLERLGIATWKDMQPSALRTFLVTQLTEIKPASRLSYASTFRSFLRWAYSKGILERDFSAAAAAVRQYRLAGIPDLLTDDELAALLQAVDRRPAMACVLAIFANSASTTSTGAVARSLLRKPKPGGF